MLVAVDKFTKWVEAAPVTTQDSMAAINFIKSIVFHFRVPHSIITDKWNKFYIEGVQKLMREHGNQAKVRIRRTPQNKWASR
jgi:transposase-like protein